VLVVSLHLAAVNCVPAQETIRMSLAGEAAAEARRKAVSATDDCTVHLGPSSWTFGSALDVQANDNILFASSEPEFDVIVSPQISTRMVWPFSERNNASLAVGTGYSAYVLHSEFNRMFVTPGSELSFDLYVGDFWIDLHEGLSITKNSYEDPTVVGIADYSQLQNSVGVTGTWDLNKIVVRLAYDHANYVMLHGEGGLPDGRSEILGLSAGYNWKPLTTFGVETGGGWIEYTGAGAPDERARDWNIGTFVEAHPMEYVSLKASAGYTVYSPVSSAGSAFTGIYARLGLNHRLNRHLEYHLSGGRSISFGFYAGTIDLYSANLDLRWHLFQKLSLWTGFEFEHGSQVLIGHETFDRFGPHLSLERQITAKMSGALRYQFYDRRSDVAGGDYTVNLVTLNIAYRL
jgi:hypothetical protein